MKILKRAIPVILLISLFIPSALFAGENSLPFKDVPSGVWYEDALKYCYSNKIINGTSPDTFSPSGKTTRGAVVMMLWNLQKNPEPKGNWYFADGGDRNPQWYTKALNWAYEAGILYGEVHNNQYGIEYRFAYPENNVTRAQLVAFLYRYTVLKGDADGKNDIYFASIFADYKKDNNWVIFEQPIAWATEARIMTGVEKEDANGKIGMYFDPGATATRAETAQFFRNILTAELKGGDGHIHHFNGYVTAGAVASTCTQRGRFTYRCNACSETRIVTRALLAHPFSPVSVKAATYRASGYIKYRCDVCGYTKTTVLPKLAPTVYERVINRTYPIPANYISNFSLTLVENGQYMEAHAAAAMKKMVAGLRAAGLRIIVSSGYRDDAKQINLSNYYTNYYGNKYKAATHCALPYTSEHQAGLAMDLGTLGEEDYETTLESKWLSAHCSEYGFILRYPRGKERYTGVMSEPWHFRYVGSPEVAKDITASGLSMEEYYGKYLARKDIDPYLPYL